MNLWNLEEKQKAYIRNIKAGVHANYITRLQEIGLTDGNEVECILVSPFQGPKIFIIQDGIFSLDQDTAQMVEIIL